jgi:hypothetical protein
MPPKASVIEGLLKRGKELSADRVGKIRALGEQARVKAKPYTERGLGDGQGGNRSGQIGGGTRSRGRQALRG